MDFAFSFSFKFYVYKNANKDVRQALMLKCVTILIDGYRPLVENCLYNTSTKKKKKKITTNHP